MIGVFGWLVSVILIGGSTCSRLEKGYSVEDTNRYIDKLFDDTIAENRAKIEPYLPGNASFGFEYKVLFVTISGKVELHDVAVSGLSTVHRDGDCTRSSDEGISKISVTLGMGELHLTSKARVSFMDYGPTVDLTAKIGYVLVHLIASRDDNAGTPPSVDDFKIYETRGEEATISGLGPLNYIANTITSLFIKLFKGTILSKAEEKLRVTVNDMIKTTNFPLIDRL